MKLNPNKCMFGVSSGKFLGFMVSQWGIKANPNKIQAILDMEPPKSIKEFQSFNGKVVALHKFVSRMIDKWLPFFKTLKAYLAVSPIAISSALIREEERI